MTLAALAALLLGGCRAGAEADDVCAAERRSDTIDADVWTVGVQVPLEAGGSVHVEARWPVDAPAAPWPAALLLHGAWNPLGTPLDKSAMRPDVSGGMVGLHLDLPGNGRTDGDNDRRGAASRAAVATALRWAAGEARDLGGCTLSERVPAADPDDLYVVGTSNGGNLAVATLADTTLDTPPVAGLVLWETPAGPQFANVELGVDPTVYTPGSCTFAPATGITCAIPEDRLHAGTVDGAAALCFDEDGDAVCTVGDVLVRGVLDLQTGLTMVSPTLAAAAEARGVLPEGFSPASGADAWWEERDAARLATRLVEARPDLPVLLVAIAHAHPSSLSPPSHVFVLGE
ncbi:MAG: hypothetical protein ACK4YP_25695, partial [Myxococcota bacterium]